MSIINHPATQQTQQSLQQQQQQQQYNAINHNQIDINGNPIINSPQIPNHTARPTPLNTQYYGPPYTNPYTNIYNHQYQPPVLTNNPYPPPIPHTQTPTQHANKPVVIPVNLNRSKTLKDKDKQFLLDLQKRHPLTRRYKRIEFNINLYEEIDSDDEDIEMGCTNGRPDNQPFYNYS